MAIVNNDVPAVNHPGTRRMRLLPTEPMDRYWLGLLALLGLILASWVSSTELSWLTSLVCLPVIALAVFSMQQPELSKYNERRYQIPLTKGKNFILTTFKRGEVYRSEASLAAEKSIRSQLIKAARQEGHTQVIDFTVDDLPSDLVAGFSINDHDRRRLSTLFPLEARGLKINEKENLGLIYCNTKQTYSVVFEADGSPIRDSSRLNQYRTMRRYASLITKATAMAGLRGLKVSMGIRNRPQDQWLIPETTLEVGDPDVVMPEAIRLQKPLSEYTPDDLMDVNLHNLQNDFAELGVQSYSVDMMIVITVNETDALRRAFKSEKMSDKEFRRLPVMRIMNVILPTLNQLVGGGVRVLDAHGIERYLRKARDVATLFNYYGEDAERKALEREQTQLDTPITPSGAVRHRYRPLSHIVSNSTCVNVDGTYASVLDLTTFPTGEFGVHDMPMLSDAHSTWSSFSVIGESVRSGREYAFTNRLSGMWSELKEKAGIITEGPLAEIKAGEQYEEQSEIARSGVRQNFVVRFAALELSEDELEFQFNLDVDRFEGMGFGPVPVTQPSQQWLKFLTTVTLVDCE